MLYILAALLIILLLYGFMIYIRKTMWDAVHRNLLDLEELYNGRVMRRGFATRPYFHGKMGGSAFTINFSTEKRGGKRNTYIDISYEKAAEITCTVSDKQWLEEQTIDAPSDFLTLQNSSAREFILRPASEEQVKKLAQNEPLKKMIDLNGLAYIFIGKSGLICELISEEVIKATQAENLDKILKSIHNLSGVFQR